mgnify:CR=1 FL=1
MVGKFKTPYTKKLIISYLQAVAKLISKSPTFRDLNKIPGPSPRTVIRHFSTWTSALKSAGLRPKTNQLIRGEKGFIRQNWRKMTDEEIAKKLGLTGNVVKYYRMQYNLWKNRKGTSKSKHKKDGMRLYGQKCEICSIPITELHHIKRRSTEPKNWAILCPTCHAAITRRMVIVENRKDLYNKLKPFIKRLYKEIRFN